MVSSVLQAVCRRVSYRLEKRKVGLVIVLVEIAVVLLDKENYFI